MKMLKVLEMPLPHCTRPSDPPEINHATFKPLFQQNAGMSLISQQV